MEDTPVALPVVAQSAERDEPMDAPVMDAPDSAVVVNG